MEENDIITDKKQYQISTNNSIYCLNVEIDSKYVTFSAHELNKILNYIYRSKFELSKIVTHLNLVQTKYTSLPKLLKFIDKAYSKNKIFIEPKSENEILLIFEVPVDFEEGKYSLKLKKKILEDKELLSILIDQINKLNSNNDVVKNKFKEIEKQINTISRKNSANRGSEGSDINEEINIIKQQLNDINMKLNATTLKSRNNFNSNENFPPIKSTISKNTDNYYNNTYKSKKDKKSEIYEDKEDDKFDNDNKDNKKIYNNERYNNNEEIYEKDEKPEIYLNNKKTKLKSKSKEKNKNGSQDDNKEIKKSLRKSNRDRDRDRDKNKDKDKDRDTNILKKSTKYPINENIKEEEKIDNNIKSINLYKKNRLSKDHPKYNDKYFILRNSLNDKDDIITNNDTLNNKIINNNEKKYAINEPSLNDSNNNNNEKKYANNSNKNNNDTKLNEKKYNLNDSNSNNTIKDNNSDNKEKKRNSKKINLINNDNNIIEDEKKIQKSRITYVEKNKKEKEDYSNKISYIYNSSPIEFKYKKDICKTNTSCGWNDMFEIYISYQNNKEYLASPDNNNYNINIISLTNNKLETSLEGHKNKIRTIRYFIKEYNDDNNNKNEDNDKENKIIYEYLISADDNHIVIVWDIINNYEIKQKIDTNYEDDIYSCLIYFSEENDINQNYVITSTYSTSNDIQNSATKIYSLEKGEYIFHIKESNYDNIYYLLLWYNKQNNKNYLIQFSYKKIIINNLEPKNNELYAKLVHEPENEHYSGFIYSKNNSDFLCTSCYNGFIHVWDLYNKKIVNVIETNVILCHIIQWSEKYVIVANFNNKSFIIVDLDDKKIYNNESIEHTMEVKCVKKMLHPKYGECLLTAGRDNIIKLWKI